MATIHESREAAVPLDKACVHRFTEESLSHSSTISLLSIAHCLHSLIPSAWLLLEWNLSPRVWTLFPMDSEGLARLEGRAPEDWGPGGRGPSLQSWWAGQEVQPRIVPARRKDALSCGFSSFLGLWNSCRLSPRHPPRGEPFSRGWQRFLFLACLPGCYDQKSMGEAEKTQNVKIRCV